MNASLRDGVTKGSGFRKRFHFLLEFISCFTTKLTINHFMRYGKLVRVDVGFVWER